MSDISGPFSTLIEDWSGVTTTAVIPSGQRRWYNNVTGYNASEVIELVGNGATTIASLLKRQPNTDGAQTLYGVKTFNSTPVIPVAAPTSDTQVANKKYVDDSISLPDGYIYGLETSADTDTDHDVSIAIGKCKDYAGTTSMELSTPITKQIDATWAEGDDAGGLFSGSVAADTTYHLFLIEKDSNGSIDAGWDTDIDCSNIPTGYTAYRRIASFNTNASANLINTKQHNNTFELLEPSAITYPSPSTTRQDVTLKIPIGIDLFVNMILKHNVAVAGIAYTIVTSPYATTTAPTSSIADIEGASTFASRGNITVGTNTSGQISIRCSSATGSYVGALKGWIDDRGQYGGK